MTAPRSKDYFAAIDLGSNSFHMLLVRMVAGRVQVVSKTKRKVRLAAGLCSEGRLDQAAKARALECLRIFANRVQDIDSTQIRAVGTATLRKVQHDHEFLAQCQQALGHRIEVISGYEEAATIYQGIAHTTAFQQHMLVMDIGGASTEVVLGQGYTPRVLNSLDMGCVSWYQRFFATQHGQITQANTQAAINAARSLCDSVRHDYPDARRALVLGASGTFKALQEISAHQGLSAHFTVEWLHSLLEQCIVSGNHQSLAIAGLKASRQTVFVSGLCILLGMCESLGLQQLQPASGALREGVVYGLLAQQQSLSLHPDLQQRTLDTLATTYHLDTAQAQRVYQLSLNLHAQLQASWRFPADADELIRAIAYLHELGLSVAYSQASAHAAYMVQHLDMPGFSAQSRAKIAHLLTITAGIVDEGSELNDTAVRAPTSSLAMRHLERILRLAMLLCQRRRDDIMPAYRISAAQEHLRIEAPLQFWEDNPFLLSLLQSEQAQLNQTEQLTVAPLASQSK